MGTAYAAGPSATLSSKAPKAASLLATATSKGSVRVIITLNTPAGAAAVGTASDAQLKASTKSIVDPFLTEVLGINRNAVATATTTGSPSTKGASSTTAIAGSNVKVMPYLPIIATDVSAADLERIAADPRVKNISLDAINFASLTESVPLIGGDAAFSAGATGSSGGLPYRVGILDSGVQYGHPFLSPRVVAATCHSTTTTGYTTLCPNGQSSQVGGNAGINCTGNSDCAHGTHVAGIAAGNLAGGNPPRGVAPLAEVFAVQVFSRPTSGRLGAFTSDMIAGLQDMYTYRTDWRIVSANMSIGGGSYTSFCDSEAIKTTIDLLRSVNIATVISSGNDGSVNAVSFPGCVSSAMTIGSTTKSDTLSSFSNSASMVDVLAPGSSINSSIPTSTYAFFSGTSMAAPHVTGAWAALRSAVPAATVSDIEAALEQTGVNVTDTRPGGSITKARINIYAALLRLRGQQAAPSNDNFANAINVVPAALDPTVVTGTNVSASLQTGEPRGNSGVQATVWWKFTAARTEPVRIGTAGSPFDTTLGVYTGSVVSGLTQIAFNDDFGTVQSQVTFNTTAGVTYYVQLGGFSSARGTATITFDHPPPANDNFASARVLVVSTSGQTVTGNNNFATLESGEPRFSLGVYRTLWYRYTPSITRNYAFNTGGSAFDTTLAIYRGTALNALTLVAANDDSNGTTASRVTAILTAGTAYYVQLGGFSSARGAATLNYAPTGPANDMIAGATLISGSPAAVTGTNVNASTEPGEVLPIPTIQATAWWRFVATSTKTMDVSTVGSAFDTTLGIFTTGGSKGMTLVAFNDDDGAVVTSRVRFSAISGRTYYIQVAGYGAASRGNIRITFPTGGSPLALKTAQK